MVDASIMPSVITGKFGPVWNFTIISRWCRSTVGPVIYLKILNSKCCKRQDVV